jgi:hypothetical protein
MRVRQRRRAVPRAKYTKPPGPFLTIEQIKRSKFRFGNEQWRTLIKLLPSKLANLRIRLMMQGTYLQK